MKLNRVNLAKVKLLISGIVAITFMVALTSCSNINGDAQIGSKKTEPAKSSITAQAEGLTPSPTVSAIAYLPVGIDCNDIITTDELYGFNPNFAISTEKAAGGHEPSEPIKEGGVSCEYTNLSGGGKIYLSISRFDSKSKDQVISDLQSSSTELDKEYGSQDLTFFKVQSGVGIAQVIHGNFVVTSESEFFGNYFDAGDFLNIALAKLH